MAPFPPPAELLAARAKRAIIGRVRAVFNDRARGEAPVVRRPDGLFGPASVVWRVHGDVTTMMVGGVSALLLQMLHPAVLAAVWDQSNFREDMLGRLRRTARFIALTSYGGRDEADAAIARVRSIHHHVTGTLPDGTGYFPSLPRRRPGPSWGMLMMRVARHYFCHRNWAPASAGEELSMGIATIL